MCGCGCKGGLTLFGGKDGVGITNIVDNNDGTFTIYYGDSSTFTTSDFTGVPGLDGADGNTILNGVVAPTTEGVDGDFYINTTTSTIYGPKTVGAWGAGTSLIGPAGPSVPALNWIAFPLLNGWVATGGGVDAPMYAIRNELLYLRGQIFHTTFTLAKKDITNVFGGQLRTIDTMSFEKNLSQTVLMRLNMSGILSYEGPNNPNVYLVLDSIPLIRILPG